MMQHASAITSFHPFTPSPPHPLNRRRGYTLVELLIVMAILGLAAAMVVPAMIRPGQFTIQAAARMVIADILYAQSEAIAHQQDRKLIFNETANRYHLTDAQGNVLSVSWKSGGADGANYIVSFANDNRFTGVRLDNVDFAGESTLTFDDHGAPLQGGTLDLVFENKRYRVSVAPFTGRVTVAPVE